jgi:hypothetical protein
MTGEDHVAVARAVDEHRVVVINATDDAAAENLRFVAALFLQAECVENGGACLAHVGLRLRMDFEHPV